MTREDRRRWDERYAAGEPTPVNAVGLPSVIADHADAFPVTGRALDLACGVGLGGIWLARRGLDVRGVDISPVAIARARDLAGRAGVGHRCRFEVADLDDGLPVGPRADVVLCHRFRDSRLDRAIVERLAPGGLLSIVVRSEVGAHQGPFRAAPGELAAAFAGLDLLAGAESDGLAWLLARRQELQAAQAK